MRVLAPVVAGQNVGRRGADLAAGQVVVAPGRGAQPGARRRARGDRRHGASRSSRGRGRASSRPATKSSSPASRSRQDRSTTSTASRSPPSSAATAAWRARCRLPATRSAISRPRSIAALAHDIVVFSGGSSVGERDLILDVLRARGTVLFHGIAVKPGKPTASARSAVRRCSACPATPRRACRTRTCCSCRSCARWRACRRGSRERSSAALPSRVVDDRSASVLYGALVDGRAEPAFKASGDITSMANADGYIEIPAETDIVEAGTMVTVTLF